MKSIKVKLSKEYFRERKNLNRFLLQCDLYIWHNQIQFQTENEFMFATIYLWEDTFNWVQTHLKNFLENSWVKHEDITNKIFDQFSDFKKHIWELFKDIDAKWTVKWTLMNLQQWGSAAVYAAEFQRIAFKTEWEDVLLIMQFYRELKNSVKNNITKAKWSEMLQAVIKLTVWINNQQHEWHMKKIKQHAPVVIM